jgi:hypothetical protein
MLVQHACLKRYALALRVATSLILSAVVCTSASAVSRLPILILSLLQSFRVALCGHFSHTHKCAELIHMV